MQKRLVGASKRAPEPYCRPDFPPPDTSRPSPAPKFDVYIDGGRWQVEGDDEVFFDFRASKASRVEAKTISKQGETVSKSSQNPRFQLSNCRVAPRQVVDRARQRDRPWGRTPAAAPCAYPTSKRRLTHDKNMLLRLLDRHHPSVPACACSLPFKTRLRGAELDRMNLGLLGW